MRDISDEAVETAMDAWWCSPSWDRELADSMRAALTAALPHLDSEAKVYWEAYVADQDARIAAMARTNAALEAENAKLRKALDEMTADMLAVQAQRNEWREAYGTLDLETSNKIASLRAENALD